MRYKSTTVLGSWVYEVQADDKWYVRKSRHLRKYEQCGDIKSAVESPEITEEASITTDKEKSVSPESHQGEGEPPPESETTIQDPQQPMNTQQGIPSPQRAGF